VTVAVVQSTNDQVSMHEVSLAHANVQQQSVSKQCACMCVHSA
jgi:hypothetical protein